jgi:hypothetical protein
MIENRILPVVLSAVLVCIAMAAHPVLSHALDEQPQFREYVSRGDHFTCSIPGAWSEYQPGFGLSQEEKKVYGVTLFGPSEGGPFPPTISVHYYAPGNLLHRTMAKFIKTHAEPVLGTPSEGESYGEPRSTVIAGRQAKIFERMNIRYTGGRTLNPGKVTLFESFAVIPDESNEGFYVLELSVPAGSRSKYTGTFEMVIKSFRPGR